MARVDSDSAFEAFFRAEHEPVVRSLTLAFGDRAMAEDAAQVGFERAYARWRRVARHDRPGTWVYVVAVRYGRRSRPAPEPAPPLPVPDESDRVVDAVWVTQLLATLPPRQREAVVLRHVADLRLDDIARAQGVTTGTVKASLHAAYRHLRVAATDDEEVTLDAPRGT